MKTQKKPAVKRNKSAVLMVRTYPVFKKKVVALAKRKHTTVSGLVVSALVTELINEGDV